MSCFYILRINPLSVALILAGCLFLSFMVFFAKWKLLSLIRFHIFIFVFITLGDGSKMMWFMSKSILPMFSFRSFIVFNFTFRSLIHFELIFVCCAENVLVSFFYMELFSFPSTTFWSHCLFLIVYSCLLYHRLIDCRCVYLFLLFPSCSIDLHVCFFANMMLFWLL